MELKITGKNLSINKYLTNSAIWNPDIVISGCPLSKVEKKLVSKIQKD